MITYEYSNGLSITTQKHCTTRITFKRKNNQKSNILQKKIQCIISDLAICVWYRPPSPSPFLPLPLFCEKNNTKYKSLIQNTKLNLIHHSLPNNRNTKQRPPMSYGTNHPSRLSHIRHTCPTTDHPSQPHPHPEYTQLGTYQASYFLSITMNTSYTSYRHN